MSSAIFSLRKHWIALSVVAVLVATVLTASALFAANELPEPELPTPVALQSVANAADLPPAPPVPERVPAQQSDHDEEVIDLPPIVKVPPKHPNLDSNLNRLGGRGIVCPADATRGRRIQRNVRTRAGHALRPAGVR